MKIEVRYKKYFAYGQDTILTLSVDPDWMVPDLKRVIERHTGVEVAYQDIYIKVYGQWKEMEDTNSLNFFEIDENSRLLLKSPYYADRFQKDEEVSRVHIFNFDA